MGRTEQGWQCCCVILFDCWLCVADNFMATVSENFG